MGPVNENNPTRMWYGGKVSCSRTTHYHQSFEFLPIFPLSLLTSTSLFLSSLRRITYACSIICPSGKRLLLYFNEPSDRETRFCLKTSLSLFNDFNESSDKDNSILFIFRESEKVHKVNSESPFSPPDPLSPKKYKTIQKG